MGVFDFVKNAGAKVGIGESTKEEAAAEAAEAAEAAKVKADARAATAKKRAKAIAEHRRTAAAKARQAEAKKSMEMEKYVRDLGLEVKRLDVRVEKGTAYVDGEVPSAADKVRLVLALGNVEGISAVDEDITIAEAADDGKDDTLHTVVSGDTLSKIAKEHYGDANQYPAIFEANKPMLTNPDLIYPGQVLRIPDLG